MFKESVINKITNFLTEIGIKVEAGNFEEETVLPGILVDGNKLIVDETRLAYPGDLLHEAGHIAVKPAAERRNFRINIGNDPAEEIMAIAWSYAALVYLKLQPEVVFHEHGYKGGSKNLIEAFQNGAYMGLPMLQWAGMAADQQNAKALGTEPFPNMIKWLRD